MPITLRIQNDSASTALANTYIDVAFFMAYHEEAGTDMSGFTDEEAVKGAIVRGKRYLDKRFSYKGEMAAGDRSSAFPRYNLTDRAGNIVLGIPIEVKEAQAEYSLIALQQEGDLNPTPSRDDTGRNVIQKSESVGPISESKTYASGAQYMDPEYPKADDILTSAGFVVTGGTIIRG